MHFILYIYCAAVFLAVAACSKVLPPIRGTGEDVAYIIIASADFTYDQYELLGLQIQESSDQNLWVQLSNSLEAEASILDEAKQQLYDAGFPQDGFIFGGGHGYGAYIATEESAASPDLVGALALFGTSVARDRESLPLPVYIINGDLDGQARVTETADSFRYIKSQVEEGIDDTKLKNPHKMVEGVNHAQFCTGEIPRRAEELWIEPEVSSDESRRMMAEAMLPFFTYYSSKNESKRTKARQELISIYDESDAFFAPVFTAFDAEQSSGAGGDTSEWAAHAQYIIGDLEPEYQKRLLTNCILMSYDEMGSARAEIIVLDNGTLLVETVASLNQTAGLNELYEAAGMIEVKYKSKQAIMEEFTGVQQPYNVTATCQQANQAAWEWVFTQLVAEKQLERFEARNITVRFLEDIYAISGPEWLDADLVFEFDGYDLEVQSTNLITRTAVPDEKYAGMHYCKMLSPAKVIEFIYVDALYQTFYHDMYE